MQIQLSDDRLTLSQAASLVGVNSSTVWRWTLYGCRGIKLATVVIGGRRQTTLAALEEFVARTTALANGEPAPTRTPRQRAQSIRQAEAELQAAGI